MLILEPSLKPIPLLALESRQDAPRREQRRERPAVFEDGLELRRLARAHVEPPTHRRPLLLLVQDDHGVAHERVVPRLRLELIQRSALKVPIRAKEDVAPSGSFKRVDQERRRLRLESQCETECDASQRCFVPLSVREVLREELVTLGDVVRVRVVRDLVDEVAEAEVAGVWGKERGSTFADDGLD